VVAGCTVAEVFGGREEDEDDEEDDEEDEEEEDGSVPVLFRRWRQVGFV
jgi:hypothetical protein